MTKKHMLSFFKGLINKNEIARIKELERENEQLRNELEELNEIAFQMHIELNMREDQEDLEELETISEKCSCGGYMIPMYDEHPNWIKFCKSCDIRSENTDASPILEP